MNYIWLTIPHDFPPALGIVHPVTFEVRDRRPTLDEMQYVVGGFIEPVEYHLRKRNGAFRAAKMLRGNPTHAFYVNEEGAGILPPNARAAVITGYAMIYGNAFAYWPERDSDCTNFFKEKLHFVPVV